MAITLTFDLEDNRRSPHQPERFTAMSERLLAFFAERGVRATVFVVGELARTHARLIRSVAEAGHEVGLHGLRHETLGAVGPQRLRADLTTGKALLEDAAGVAVRGFRAPIFSLTPSSAWATDDLLETGFDYSSSVLPAANPLHGWPGAPQQPFRWANGLVELPCPVLGSGRAQIPYLGGIYLRYVPLGLTRRALRNAATGPSVAWSYVHPYDIDSAEPFFVLPHAGWVTSRILHTRRKATLDRLDSVLRLAGGAGAPLAERVDALVRDDLPVGV